jgi:hypothetical protein
MQEERPADDIEVDNSLAVYDEIILSLLIMLNLKRKKYIPVSA